MGKLRKKHRKKEMLDLSLNITSLMDVLTVLLFFLLKSFSVSAQSVTTPPGMRLPDSESKAKLEETVVVTVTDTGVKMNDAVVVKMASGRFLASDMGPDQRTLLPLKAALDKEFKKRNQIFNPEEIDYSQLPPGRILIQADKQLPFQTMKFLLHTASTSGYSEFQFLVSNPEAD